MPRLIDGQKFYSAAEAAQIAGVHKITLLRWIKAGKVPSGVRDRRRWRLFSAEDVERIKTFAFMTVPADLPADQQLALFTRSRSLQSKSTQEDP